MREKQMDGNAVRSRKDSFRAKEAPHLHDEDVSDKSAQNLELFRACFEHATIGFLVTDLEGRVLEVNPAYCSIT
jgi:PAS domain-containing protein